VATPLLGKDNIKKVVNIMAEIEANSLDRYLIVILCHAGNLVEGF